MARKNDARVNIITSEQEFFAFKRLLLLIILTSPVNNKFHPRPVRDARATCQWPYRLVKPWKKKHLRIFDVEEAKE